ncbi:MAG TPA: ABC transporter ATP-binding protein [Steroidobacteraceae bacterium]|nr:ABC transporter ATP-binding protein [Steroidobacteraceae bacterium]
MLALTVLTALFAALLEGLGTVTLLQLLGLLGGPTHSGIWARSLPILASWHVSPVAAALLVCVIAIGMRSLMVGLREYFVAQMQLGFAGALRLRLFDALCAADWGRIVGRRRSNVLHALTDEITQIERGIQSLIQGLAAVFLVAVLLAVMSLLSMKITLLVALAMLLWLWLLGGAMRRNFEAGTLVGRIRERAIAAAADSFYGLKQIRSQALERVFRGRFLQQQQELEHRLLRLVRTSQLSDSGFQLGAAGALALLLWLATQRFHLGVARTAVLIVVLARLAPLITSLVQSLRQVALAAPACNHVLAMAREIEGCGTAVSALPRSLARPWRTIRFDGVGFRYGEGLPWVLQHLDLSIRANSTTVVLGLSGSGKTTLIDLLVGLLRPSAGRISVDDVALQSLDTPQWARDVAYVVQDGMLWDMSIRDNLTLGLDDIDDEEIAHALQGAGAIDVAKGAEHGLDSATGERGERFSGGERQRLALAQALLRRPRLLVLDEPSSALDAACVETLRQTLTTLHGRMTIVIATHDTRLVPLGDQTIDLSEVRRRPAMAAARGGLVTGIVAADPQ